MPLSKPGLTTRIVDAVKAIPGVTIDAEAELEAFAEAIAESVIDELTENGLVTVTGNSVVASGSSAGTWPVTGTGTIT